MCIRDRTKITAFGAFIELSHKIDGLIHISQLSKDHIEKVKDVLGLGDEIEARVIKIDQEERRIGLSIKAAQEDYNEEALKQAEKELTAALRPGEDMVAMGDILSESLDGIGEGKQLPASLFDKKMPDIVPAFFFDFQAQRYNHSVQLRARKMRDFFSFKIERYKFNYILRAQQSQEQHLLFGMQRSLVSAFDWGSKGRKFESCHPDHFMYHKASEL
eukprot:TRINITY_DN8264_c0_g2_i1.p1 TRINITY_DN8264_c0_g2~~TRINITY_DN8264_c0_g2_i1.p1  ORF type:complete len:217 (+),score=4.38 TRINITY_DN8264_c0_g2_i1:165-815(+)